MTIRILNVVGARPNFMKIAPLMRQYKQYPDIEPILVHTGQHYDSQMSDLFFEQLGIDKPNVNLEVGSGSHAVQTAEIMKAFEPVLLKYHPDWVVVVGDVNSTVACGLVATKLGVKLAHVEAGLRSGDRGMPEEINRILTDAMSDLLFCTEESGVENLNKEGIHESKIHFVGHVMIDTLMQNLEKAEQSLVFEDLGLEGIETSSYALLTLHRPSNVDDASVFSRILDAIEVIQQQLPVLFPVHPRTRNSLARLGLGHRIGCMKNLKTFEPVGYLDFLKLMKSAKLVLTDSGGIQEETTALQIPCVTLRETTERPVTCSMGSNRVVGTDPRRILEAFDAVKDVERNSFAVPQFWDGLASQRIVSVLHAAKECHRVVAISNGNAGRRGAAQSIAMR